MTNFNRVATLALGLLTIASTAPALAQPNGDRTNAGRAAAIRECNRAATPYREYLWGDFEIDVYRSCMAQRGQQNRERANASLKAASAPRIKLKRSRCGPKRVSFFSSVN